LGQSVDSKHDCPWIQNGQATIGCLPCFPKGQLIGLLFYYLMGLAATLMRAYALTSTLTWRSLAASFLGSITVSTPLWNSALILSVSKVFGTAKLRTKLP